MKKQVGLAALICWFMHFPGASFGATGAQLVMDLNPGSAGSFPCNLTVHANTLFFNAYTLATGRELWKYDGRNVTLVADINDTKDDLGGGVFEGNDSLPAWPTSFNGELFFSAYEPRRGDELWKYDGVTVQRVTDINPDQNDTIKISPNSSWPAELTVFNNALYFSANDNTARTNYELWKYDGVAATLVTNIHADLGTNYSSYPNSLFAWNGALYFMADNGTNGFELWRHDGTNTILTDINPGDENSSSYPKKFTPFKNDLMFVAARDDVGYELWKTDGATVTLAADINLGPDSSYPSELIEFNGALYFQAADATNGSELWKYDGATATLAADINPAGDSFPKNLTVFGLQLFFTADDGAHGWELWKFNGSQAQIVADLNPVGDSFPENLVVLSNVLYFTATTPETGYELFKYDGTNVTIAADINAGPGDSFPQFLTIYDGKLFFRAAGDGTSDWELWSYTPEAAQPPPPDVTVQFSGAQLQGADIHLAWKTAGGSTNVVQSANAVIGPFTNLSQPIVAPGSGEVLLDYTDVGAANQPGARFYRIKRF
jgi:ELWxxDGT repeat protein